MASGLDVQNPPVQDHPFEWALGHVAGSPMAKLKNEPGAAFHYSNAGVAHLVLLFKQAAGEDLFPFLKRKLFEPIGETQLRWTQIGGDGAIGPFSQGYSGIFTNPASTPGFATWRCTRANGRANALSLRRTTNLPGKEPRSRLTTVHSGGLSRIFPVPRLIWS